MDVRQVLLLLLCAGWLRAQDALPDGPVDAVLGRNVTFQTVVGPSETFLTITWSFNGGGDLVPVVTIASGVEKVDEDYVGRVWLNKTSGVLTLGPLTAADNGDYSVIMVNNLAGTKTGETRLRVLEPVSKVEIRPNMMEAVELNSTVVLNCTARGSFLKFTWTNGTAPLVADGKRRTIKEGDLYSALSISGVLRSELLGPIRCTAGNKLESEKSAPFNLSVSFGPDNVVLAGVPSVPMVRKGANVTLTCSTLSLPAARFQWYHEDVLQSDTGSTLVMKDVTEKHSGNYTCIASNAKTLRYVASNTVHFSVLEAISGVRVAGPASLLAGNQSANLTCSAAAGTVATWAWLKDKLPLVPSERVVVAADGSRVTFDPVRKDDNAEFTCRLSNAISSDSAHFKMVVNFGPEPVVLNGEEAVEVTHRVELKCSAMSVPAATYTWSFNGTMQPVTTPVYTIDKAVYSNTGKYTCKAHNAITGLSSEASHWLVVKEEGALEGLSDGAIAGIIIGVLLALALAVAAIIYIRRKRPVQSPY